MAVTSFALERVQGAQDAHATITAEDTQFLKRYKVRVDSDLDEGQAIYADMRCPKIGDYYTQGAAVNFASRVVQVQIDPIGGAYANPSNPADHSGDWAFSVEVTYSRKGETVENPLLRPAKLYYDMEQYDAPLDRDLDNKPVLNSAYQPFDPPVLKEDNRLIIRIEKNLPNFNPAAAVAFENAVNSTTFLGFAANTLRITKITGSPVEDANFGTYYATATEIQFRPFEHAGFPPHQANILDMGRYEIDTSAPELRVPILDKDGSPVVDSEPLNGFGKKLQSGQDPFYLKFRRYPSLDFNALGIYP